MGLLRSMTAALMATCAAVSVHADNWPHWRGPAAIGVSPETNLPDRWSDTENIAWKAPVRGLGISSPIVWGDYVFVTSQIGRGNRRAGNHPTLVQGGSPVDAGERALGGGASASSGESVTFLVTALRRTDGSKLWEYSVPAEGRLNDVHDKHNLASSSPVTDGKHVYAWFGTGQLVALDTNGKLIWSRHLGREVQRLRHQLGAQQFASAVQRFARPHLLSRFGIVSVESRRRLRQNTLARRPRRGLQLLQHPAHRPDRRHARDRRQFE